MSGTRRIFEHGTEVSYRRGCKCDECRQAHNANNRRFKHWTDEGEPKAERDEYVQRLMRLAERTHA